MWAKKNNKQPRVLNLKEDWFSGYQDQCDIGLRHSYNNLRFFPTNFHFIRFSTHFLPPKVHLCISQSYVSLPYLKILINLMIFFSSFGNSLYIGNCLLCWPQSPKRFVFGVGNLSLIMMDFNQVPT